MQVADGHEAKIFAEEESPLLRREEFVPPDWVRTPSDVRDYKQFLDYAGPKNAKLIYYYFKVANSLFPGHFIEVVNAENDRKGGRLVTYSKKVETDRTYHVFYEHLRNWHNGGKKCETCEECAKHLARASSPVVEELKREMRDAGIRVNDSPGNVGFVEDRPVFFEISRVDAGKLKDYITKTRKTGSKRLLNFVKRIEEIGFESRE